MASLAEMIPDMSDDDLSTLRTNALRLSETGSSAQVLSATEILPVIDTEVARRAALPRPAVVRKQAAAKAKVQPATGHQTALPPRRDKA